MIQTNSQKEKIAIIGQSFELPGAINIIGLWKGLLDSKVFYTVEPPNYSVKDTKKFVVKSWGGIKNQRIFDYQFFGYSYKEACRIDPQQRLLLQHGWWAMEDAGYMKKGALPPTAIFASASENHYLQNNLSGELEQGTENETLLGNLPDFLATRIAYKLGTTGPAMTIQCGCSSSLAALHQARVALLTGQAELALVGAVSLAAPDERGYRYEPGGIRSRDGYVRPFDHEASGTVFTNGVAALVLKPYAKAIRDRDKVLGVIEGSALNNDGCAKASFTAPTASSQGFVIRKAMKSAGIRDEEIALLEAHGTGTALGDPVEFAGLTQAFASGEGRAHGCALQSIKANLGHLDTVSGMAGVLKGCLVLKHGLLPPQANFSQPNPHLDLVGSPFYINTEPRPIPTGQRYVGVSATGIGGTNAHVIMSAGDQAQEEQALHDRPGLFLLSADDPVTFATLSERYRQWAQDATDLEAAASVTQVGRTPLRLRRSIWAETSESLKKALGLNVEPTAVGSEKVPIAFLFPGQGAQYPRMGGWLYDDSAFFRWALDAKLKILKELSGLDYGEILLSGANGIHEPQHTQPVLLAFEVAFQEYLAFLGVVPDVLVGHSLGEYSAAVASGAIAFEQAAALVLERARLVQTLPQGAMCAVLADREAILPLLPPDLDIAAWNSPQVTVVSGEPEALGRFVSLLERNGIPAQRLKVERAFHSRMLEPILPAYGRALEGAPFWEPGIPILSSLDGEPLSYQRLRDPDYWLRQMRQPVNFMEAIENLHGKYGPCLLEVGPGTTLRTLATQVLAGRPTMPICSPLPLPNGEDRSWEGLYRSLGSLWERGVDIDWQRVRDTRRRAIPPPMPTYPFRPVECWVHARQAAKHEPKPDCYQFAWVQLPSPPTQSMEASDQEWGILHEFGDNPDNLQTFLTSALNPRLVVDEDAWSGLDWKGSQDALAGILAAAPPRMIFLTGGRSGADPSGELCRLLRLVQAWARTPSRPVKQLIVVTSGGLGFQGPVLASQAALAAAVKSSNQEYTALAARLIDVGGEGDYQALLKELTVLHAPPIVGLRLGERFGESYRQVSPEPAGSKPSNAPLVILGGTGQVGLQYAQALLEQSSSLVYLVQRSPVSAMDDRRTPAQTERSTRLRSLVDRWPDRIQVVQADIENRDQLRNVLARATTEYGRIGALIHAAGVDASLHYRLLEAVEPEFCRHCFASKCLGLSNMAALAEEFAVPRCHVVSSISSALGGIGMFVYGAMHAWLDAKTLEFARQDPSRWSLVNWEAWDLGNEQEGPEWFKQGAFGSRLDALAMPPEQGRKLLDSIWKADAQRWIVSSMDMQTRHGEWVENLLVSTPERSAETAEKVPRSSMQTEYAAPATPTERALASIWSNLLAVTGIGADDNFFELGGHSLLAMRMAGAVNQATGGTLSMVDIFRYPTIRKLAAHLGEKEEADGALVKAKLRAQKRSEVVRKRILV